MQFQTLKLRITNSLTDILKLKLAPVKISKILLVSYAKITYKKFINRHAEIEIGSCENIKNIAIFIR